MEQRRVHEEKPAPQKREEEPPVDELPGISEQGEKIKTELDDLLDEIDGVLEKNAKAFVENYVQKGGE